MAALGEELKLETVDFSEYVMRIAIHLDISDDMIPKIEKKLRYVINEYLTK